MKRKSAILLLLFAILFLWENAHLQNREIETDYEILIEEDTYYKILGNSDNNSFIYFVFDSNGKTVENGEVKARVPSISYVSDDIIEIRFHGGTFAELCKYYDINNDEMSENFWNPFLIEDGKIVYQSDEKLVVQDIFDENVFYKEFVVDMILTGAPESIEFIDGGKKLEIQYMKQSNYEEVTEVFDLT